MIRSFLNSYFYSFIIFHSKSDCIMFYSRIPYSKNHGTHIFCFFFSTCSHTLHCILFLRSIRMRHLSATRVINWKKMLEVTYSLSRLLFDFSNVESSSPLKLSLELSLMELLSLILWKTLSISCQQAFEFELIPSWFLKLKELTYQRFEHKIRRLRGYYSSHLYILSFSYHIHQTVWATLYPMSSHSIMYHINQPL